MRTFCENANVEETDICRKVLSGGMDQNLQLLILIFYERTRVGGYLSLDEFCEDLFGEQDGGTYSFPC